MLTLRAIATLSFVLVLGCSEASEPTAPDELPRLGSTTAANAGEPATEEPRERPVLPRPAPEPEPAGPADQRAPDQFTARLVTTKGNIDIEVHREWAPRGADRFYTLIREGYYQDVAFFRVIEGFMAQTGLHGDPEMNARWRGRRIQDDPVVQHNRRGYVSYAMAGPGTRTTQFFINLVDNTNLDSMGFAPFGIVRDMSTVDQLHDGYGEGAPRGQGPQQARIQREGNAYLRRDFPELDYIRSASIVP